MAPSSGVPLQSSSLALQSSGPGKFAPMHSPKVPSAWQVSTPWVQTLVFPGAFRTTPVGPQGLVAPVTQPGQKSEPVPRVPLPASGLPGLAAQLISPVRSPRHPSSKPLLQTLAAGTTSPTQSELHSPTPPTLRQDWVPAWQGPLPSVTGAPV